MQVPHYKSIHNRFKINGFTLEREEIFQLAFTLIREGDDFEIEAGIFLMDWFDENDYVVIEKFLKPIKSREILVLFLKIQQ